MELLLEKTGSIAVLPVLFDAASVLGRELLYSGFPFIASTQSALNDLIVEEDIGRVIADPTADALSLKFSTIIGKKGILLIL